MEMWVLSVCYVKTNSTFMFVLLIKNHVLLYVETIACTTKNQVVARWMFDVCLVFS